MVVVDAGEQHEGSVAQERAPWLKPYRFLPGQSGNPSGGAKGAVSLAERLKARLRDRPEEADEVVATLLKDALEGEPNARKLLFDRHDGAVALKIEGLSEQDMAERLIALLGWLKERLPEQYHPLLSEGAREVVGKDEPG